MASNPFYSPQGPHALHHPSAPSANPQTGHSAFAAPTPSPYGLAAPHQHQQAHQPQSHAQPHRYAPPLPSRGDLSQSAVGQGPTKGIVKRQRGGVRARPVSRAVTAIEADTALFDPPTGHHSAGTHQSSAPHGGQSSLLQQLQQQQAQQQRSLSHGHHTTAYGTAATQTSAHGHHSQTTHHQPHHHHQQPHALSYPRIPQLNGTTSGPGAPSLSHHQTQATQHHHHQQYHQSVVVPTTGPIYEADGIQFKLLEELPEAKVKRLRSEKIKPIEDLTFEDIKAYNRNQLRAYCFVYGIKRKKKAEMEQNMARYASMFHPNDPSFDISTFEPTDYVDGPIPRRRVPVTKEQKASSAGKFAARFLPTQRPRPAEALQAPPHFSAPTPASAPPAYAHQPLHTQPQSLHTQQYQQAPQQHQHRQQHQPYYNVPLHNFADIE